jgi:hypothetical protein
LAAVTTHFDSENAPEAICGVRHGDFSVQQLHDKFIIVPRAQIGWWMDGLNEKCPDFRLRAGMIKQ